MKARKQFSGSIVAQVDIDGRRVEFVLQTDEFSLVFPMCVSQTKELIERLGEAVRFLEEMRMSAREPGGEA